MDESRAMNWLDDRKEKRAMQELDDTKIEYSSWATAKDEQESKEVEWSTTMASQLIQPDETSTKNNRSAMFPNEISAVY